jgi:hypothetical protein
MMEAILGTNEEEHDTGPGGNGKGAPGATRVQRPDLPPDRI